MFNKRCFFFPLLLLAGPLAAAELDLTPQEAAVVAAIKAQNTQEVPSSSRPEDEDIKLPEETKRQAFEENEPPVTDAQEAAPRTQQTPAAQTENQPQAVLPPAVSPSGAAEPDPAEEEDLSRYAGKCLTVAYIDIDEAFNKHPRTVAVKEQIRLKILAKEQEVESAKQIIDALNAENALLSAQLLQLKPFYERIVVQPQEFEPKITEKADSLLLGNIINRLIFSGAEVIAASPLNTPEELENVTVRIASNKKIIAERGFFIDNYKYATREEILKLEEKEVKAILKDIYTEIKSFAKKRNIGGVVC